MKNSQFLNFIFFSLVTLIVSGGCNRDRIGDSDYPIRPVPFTDVEIKDDLWAQRIRTNHDVTIPYALDKIINDGRLGDDEKFADRFMDVYKVVEGTCYSLQTFPDPKIENYVDSIIWLIGLAQEDDGYLYCHPRIGHKRWVQTHVSTHELYNMGLLHEAAVAHYQLTGRRSLMDIAIKNADLIIDKIGPGKFETYPGHQGIEIGLSRLYRVTGDKRYLDHAKYFLDARGDDHIGEPPFRHNSPTKTTYNQAHMPVTEQTEAVGHAVRALYMYAGMADVAALTGDSAYIDAIDRIWEDFTCKKFYITGGVGSRGSNEGFGHPYDLPNSTAYCETCAGIANVFWNHRLFLLHGEAKYIDVMERSLYNNVLSGIAMTGDRFFYTNRLESYGQDTRSEWFTWSCCPTNIVRLIPSLPGYIYAYDDDDMYVNLFISSETSFDIGGSEVGLSQVSGFPWSGDVKLKVSPQRPVNFSLRVRIPGWSMDQPVPGDLYTFVDEAGGKPVLKVNGESYPVSMDKGYAVVKRTWREGDVVELNIPMDIRRIKSRPEVAANEGRLALQRGPLVYCGEWPEFNDKSVLDIIIDKNTPLVAEHRSDLLGGLTVLKGDAKGSQRLLDGEVEVYDKAFTAIPYYGWAHRGAGQMLVWFAESAESVKAKPAPTLAYTSTIKASHFRNSIHYINNQDIPRHSNDINVNRYSWRPGKDQLEFIIYEFERPSTISLSQVYWFDEGPGGSCRIPAGYRILYKSGNEWVPVETTTPYEVSIDELNEVEFKPVVTSAVKLEVQLPENTSSGLYEWAVK